MKLLIISHEPRSIDIKPIFNALASYFETEIIFLDKSERKKQDKILSKLNLKNYDRIFIDLAFRYTHLFANSYKKIPNLYFYEQDGCQNFLVQSKWHKQIEKFYKKLPHAKFIHTGFYTSERFRSLGFNSYFVPKGFNETLLGEDDIERDIELGFIGRLGSKAYSGREKTLMAIAEQANLQIMRTSSVMEYRHTLNRIKIFVSADVGFGEYMTKNFEALGCGCLLLAYRQSNGEEQALGLKDMENIALYNSVEEAIKKITYLKENPRELERLSKAGKLLADKRFSHEILAKQIALVLKNNQWSQSN